MADSTIPAPGGSDRSPVDRAASWLAKTVKGSITVSLKSLVDGLDVGLILSHESCHDILVSNSVFGQQMEILAAFGQPPAPQGRLQAKARSLLREGMAASIRLQEGCATFVPSRRLSGTELDSYWAGVPTAYRRYAESLEWLRARELADEVVIAIVFGLGGFAMGVRFAGAELANGAAFVNALGDPARNPDERFVAACRTLSGVADADLVALAPAKSAAEAIAGRWYPRANGEVAYEARPFGAEWRSFWQELVNEIASVWSTDSRPTEAEREMLAGVQRDAVSLAPSPADTILKAKVEQIGWRERPILRHPPIDRLLGYRLATIEVNPMEYDLVALEIEGERALSLAPGEASVELVSRRLPEAVAVLSSLELSEYVRRADVDTTICCIDASYIFEVGDLIAHEPLVRHRPHVVLLQRQSLGTILIRLDATGTIAGDHAANYTVVGSEVRGLSYFVIRPASMPYPLVIAPVPEPTADRAMELIRGGEYGKLGWQYQSPPDFVKSAGGMGVSLVRVCATFEDVGWPEQFESRSESEGDPRGHDDEDAQLSLYNGIIGRFDSDPEPGRREVVATALLDKGERLDALDRYDEALAAYEEIVRRFGNESDLQLSRSVAEALANTAATLGHLGRYPETFAACDEVVVRFGDVSDGELREHVARTLATKALAFGRMQRYGEAIEVHDQVVARFEQAGEPPLRAEVARALVGKGMALGREERHAEALVVFDEVDERYAADTESAVCEQVAKARAEIAETLGRLKRYEEALSVFDQVEQPFVGSADPGVRRQVAIALVNKAIMLTTLERYDEALEVYDFVAVRFYEPSDPGLASSVASAFFNKGLILGRLGRLGEAIESYDEVVARFASASDPELCELVTMARANKASRLAQAIAAAEQTGRHRSWFARWRAR